MFLHTFSVVARCRETGRFGAAVASHFPGVGAYAPYVRSGVGAMVVQGWVNPSFGLHGMEMLERGMCSEEVLERLLFRDPGRELRQLAIVDRNGTIAVHTGAENDHVRGHLTVRVVALTGFPYVDFRVDHHPDPVFELNRIYRENKGLLIDRYEEWVESVRNGVPFPKSIPPLSATGASFLKPDAEASGSRGGADPSDRGPGGGRLT
jgi:uncharacterized Ntn-hydrolase superfamily protein